MSLMRTRRYTKSIARPCATSFPPEYSRSRGSQTMVGTPLATNASRSISNSLKVGHFAPVHDGHQRRRPAAAPVAIARQQRVEQVIDGPIHPRAESVRCLAESRHQVGGVEDLGEALAVAGARRRLGVVFGELQRVRQEKRIRASRRARRRIPGIDPGERDFRLGDGEIAKQRVVLQRGVHDALAERPQHFGRLAHARLVVGLDEKRPEKRTEEPATERQPASPHVAGEALAHGRRRPPNEVVPERDGIGHRGATATRARRRRSSASPPTSATSGPVSRCARDRSRARPSAGRPSRSRTP